MRLEVEQEDDGRWLAEAPALPGVMAYGDTREEAIIRVETLAFLNPAGSGEAAPSSGRVSCQQTMSDLARFRQKQPKA